MQRKRNDVEKQLGLKEIKKASELTDNSIIMNEIDKDIYHDLVDQFEAMQDNLEGGLKEYAPFDRLSEDIFGSLYKPNVKMNDEEDMKSFTRFNHGMMEELLESESYGNLRKATKYDQLSSAIGTEVLQEQAMNKIQYFKEQYTKQKQTGQQQEGGAAGELIDQLNEAGNIQQQIDDLMAKCGGDPTQLTREEARKLAELQHRLNRANQEIEHNFDGQQQLQQGMQQQMKEATKIANQIVEEVQDMVNAWGLETGMSGKRISIDKRKKSIERIRRSPRLRELTDMIGRMKKIAMQKKKKKLPEGHNIETVELGNKLESLIPSEMMKLANDKTKKDFMLRYQQKQLLQYKKIDIQKVGRGPVVLCHDKSGSMDGPKDDWSTALALATLEIAQKEKRNYAYIPYENHVIGNRVKNIKAGELDPDDIMDIAEMDTGGGTNFMAPLDEALRCIVSDTYKKGDIVFVTDGDCGVSDEWLNQFLAAKKEHQFYVNTVVINIGGGGASRGTVQKFSDNIVTISNIAELDDANAAEIFRIIEDKDKFAGQAGVPAGANGLSDDEEEPEY